jgi:L-phenylalanine/L-methionine N-acetyltransferase
MPEHGTVVATFESPHGPINLRYLQDGDAPALLDFINALSREQTFILFQGEQLTLAQEEAWLRDRLDEIAAGNRVHLVAMRQQLVAGAVEVSLKPLAERHVGVIGISVASAMRGIGLGQRLLEAAIAEAAAYLDGLRLFDLDVFANNVAALALYRKLGFVEYARLPGGVRHAGTFVDLISMYRPASGEAASRRERE